MSKKTDTKEKIILAAFSFYKNPSMEKVSLSKIAARVGITKAAIYKHFSGREDLERAMSDYIYDTTQAELAALRKKRSRPSFKGINGGNCRIFCIAY